ncbi:membrane protein insertion efficiency factor YidD [Uliginosibacterium silvisoli]|uniref:membrane protein insertion efficiency factor YidD n=1 Tax=Uliginosibacterium silvisoli TaxID=3114758 RepID=UPI003A7F434F
MRHAIASSIGFYQRSISPLKGFCCAHNHVHNRGSCSQFAKRVVLRFGVIRLMPLMRLRFSACHQAFLTLSEVAPQPEKSDEELDKDIDNCAKYCAADAAMNIACCSLLSFFP